MKFAGLANIARSAFIGISFLVLCNTVKGQSQSNCSTFDETSGVNWRSVLTQSFYFDAVENGFRVATQPDTRATMGGPFFKEYARSLDNLHGWGDGDPFLVNYVGHPMQGSVSGYIFVQNDPRFACAEFGKNRAYWKSRLRATAWAWIYSEQFEIGPLSEATIGHTQAYFPQQGFVDHAITPSVGLLWMIGEDSIDKYVVRLIERHTDNRYLKMFARAGLNPSRSMANMLRGDVPWHRDTRPGLFGGNSKAPMIATSSSDSSDDAGINQSADRPSKPGGGASFFISPGQPQLTPPTLPRLEIGIDYDYFRLSTGHNGSQSCNGGAGRVQYNVNSWLGVVSELAGCKMMSPGPDVSGDSTTYVAGPRFTLRKFGRWAPYVQVLGGGDKFTIEDYYPNRRPPESVIQQLPPYVAHSLYTNADQRNAWAVEVGGGVDYVMNAAFAFHAVEIDDVHTWAGDLNQRFYTNNVRVNTGLVVRWGTW